ncbi:hypothetical protein G7066_03030 [Leucobacter coleopterorum]|uniref:DUF5979 domain-containing protein n=1 Tax=Leucobacter coleopterorum TaxID=2714933 RepID=A0ABX6JY88_9MICO|nr:DUF5979 domain-containing protein [Leucobacter coleopterorum]QIM17917.1 hypothetical protein G7066_03030 [Leucobacter coleopterorum]
MFAPDQLFGDSAVNWRNLTGTTVLVAQHATKSRMTIDASNKTAIGVSGVLPENQWSATGSIAVGLDRIGASVGGDPDLGANPFAINSFSGIESMIWPEMNDAPKTGTEAQKRVAGKITYTYADGSTLDVAAPVGATAAQMNPPEADWDKIVDVSVTWQQNGKYVGLKRAAATVQGRLVFQLTLLDKVRQGYSYKFLSGEPTDLTSGQSIDGAFQTESGKVSQLAEVRPVYSAAFGDMKLTNDLGADKVVIDVADSSVAVSLRNTTGGTLYRDLLPSAAWTLAVKNTGNIPVSALRSSTSSGLLDGKSWPDSDPAGYSVEPGSLFDAFDVTRARVVYPSGARTATVWARGADGAWSSPIAAGNGSYFTLPLQGDGPKAWSDVTGFRVQYTGDEILGMRIAMQAEGSLLIETKLRATLRSDPNVISPATKLPENQTQWQVPGTGAGASYLGTFVAPLAEMIADTALAYITPGSPSPKVNKYAGTYNAATNTGTTTANTNPGAWTNFYIVVSNLSGASSNLSDLQVVDTLPKNLIYNAANSSAEWSVASAPAGVSTTPVFTETTGAETQLRWVWPEGQSLKPNERIVLKVPLQMRDGVPTGSSAVNSARLVASGIPGATVQSVCQSEDSASANCVSTAAVTSLRNDSVRIESYAQAGVVDSKTIDGEECSPSTIADWQDGTWVRNPCVVETSTGGTMTYRLKLINSGNNDIRSLRFADELPAVGDRGVVLPGGRGSEWTPKLVPGSVRLIGGEEAEALGARGDGTVADAFRYSSTADPCVLNPDAYAGQKTLECGAGTWTSAASTSSKALGGDVAFGSGSLLRGGEFVIVEFKMSVPSTSTTAAVAWNSAAITGRATPVSDWLPAAESARSGGRAQDTTLTLNLALADSDAAKWHLKAQQYVVYYSCLAPGETVPLTGQVTMKGISKIDGVETATIQNLPRGAECQVTDESYQPLGTTGQRGTPQQYGSVATGATGYSYTTDPEDPLVLGSDPALNVITTTNAYAASSVLVSAVAQGDAVSYLPAGSKFQVDATCEFGGFTETYGPFMIESGAETPVEGLPVGANCSFEETDHLGASYVAAAVDGGAATLDSNRGLRMLTIEPGAHTLEFINTFAAGGDLTVLKTVETPKAGTAVGDVTFGISCVMGGVALDLGTDSEMTLSFGPGATSTSGSISDLPVGSACTVSETNAGGANIAAPDKTVTILDGTQVTVEMTNVFSPALLELNVAVDGSAAAKSWVPKNYDITAVCTRELTIGGNPVTVTDFGGSVPVTVGKKVEIRDLPQGSRCAVTEPDNKGAQATKTSSQTAGVVDHSTVDESSLVDLRGPSSSGAAQETAVLVTNTFEAGDVKVSKKVTGDAPKNVDYEFAVACTRADAGGNQVSVPLENSSFKLNAGSSTTLSVWAGASCVVTETQAHGALSQSFAGGQSAKGTSSVMVEVPAASSPAAEVTVTNQFAPAEVVAIEKDPVPGLSVTGAQNSMIWVGGALLLVVGLGLTLLALRRRRKDRADQEEVAQDPEV